MPTLITPEFKDDLAINIDALLKDFTEEDFFDMCRRNPDLRVEMSKEGDIIFMPPIGGETSGQIFKIIRDFGIWAIKDGTGIGFESKASFIMPNGAKRSPYISWIKLERWNKLSKDEREWFPHICPDFIVELRLTSDPIEGFREKMEEYIENGARLGWLIDPIQKKIYVYRPNAEVEELDNPASISGYPLLKDFVLDLKDYFG
ncbi:MAG TPA: Uma2 family endonuclease [Blastocatellia bacterium]|nr:Uma2 family endonuclease [Blastocatellia bacterium]